MRATSGPFPSPGITAIRWVMAAQSRSARATRQALTPAVVAGVIRTPMTRSARQPQAQPTDRPSSNPTPGRGGKVIVEDPRQTPPPPPLALAQNDHVVDAALDGEA